MHRNAVNSDYPLIPPRLDDQNLGSFQNKRFIYKDIEVPQYDTGCFDMRNTHILLFGACLIDSTSL